MRRRRTRGALVLVASLAVSVASGGCTGGEADVGSSGLSCPDGTRELARLDGVERWCARPDDTAHGPYELWSGGRVGVRGSFAEGLADGLWTGYDEAGDPRFEHRFDAGVPCGAWWDAVGDGREERTFTACGEVETDPYAEQRAPTDLPDAWDGETCAEGAPADGGPEDPFARFCVVAGVRHGPFARWESADREVRLAEGSYADGALDGDFRAFWATGGLRLEGRYVDGGRDGDWRSFDADGWLVDVGAYADDLRDGAWTAWYPAGPIRSTSAWRAGDKHGDEHTFHPDGTPEEDLSWVEGRRDGPYRRYHAGGLGLAVEGTFADERRSGAWAEYARSGQEILAGTYVDGVRQGRWEAWSADGEPVSRGDYDDGVAVGEWTLWQDQGALRIAFTGAMSGGVAHGTWVGTWSTGEPYDAVSYVLGSREGAYTAYWPNGNRFAEGAYLADALQGPWTFWREDGTVAGEATYQRGALVEGWGEVPR